MVGRNAGIEASGAPPAARYNGFFDHSRPHRHRSLPGGCRQPHGLV